MHYVGFIKDRKMSVKKECIQERFIQNHFIRETISESCKIALHGVSYHGICKFHCPMLVLMYAQKLRMLVRNSG